jgi:hypothetical protein
MGPHGVSHALFFKIVDTKAAAAHLACSVSFLQKCRGTGGGPRFHKLGKAVRYTVEELDAYAAAREHASTAEYAGEVLAS